MAQSIASRIQSMQKALLEGKSIPDDWGQEMSEVGVEVGSTESQQGQDLPVGQAFESIPQDLAGPIPDEVMQEEGEEEEEEEETFDDEGLLKDFDGMDTEQQTLFQDAISVPSSLPAGPNVTLIKRPRLSLDELQVRTGSVD